MGYLSQNQLDKIGFKSLGRNILISDKASIYDADRIILGNNVRVDDFCLLSGSLSISDYTHFAPYCMAAGGKAGITIEKYVTLAYGVKVFSESDDYSGYSAVGSLMPEEIKKVKRAKTVIGQLSILGTNSVVLPGCNLGEGVALGAGTIATKPLAPWWIYIGTPARPYKERSRNIQMLVTGHIQ